MDVFHKLWSLTKGRPGYVKDEWMELQRQLENSSVTVPLETTLLPERLKLVIGNLEIRSKDDPGLKTGHAVDVLIDGKPFLGLRAITVRVAMDEVVSAQLEYYP